MALLPRFASTSLQLSAQDFVSFGTPSGLTGLSSFTVEAWVFPNSLQGFQAVLTQADLAPNTGAFQLYLQDGYATAYYPSAPFVIQSPQPIPVGDWTYLASTYDLNTRLLTLYVNGLQVAQQAFGPATLVTSDSVLVGAVLANAQPTWFFQGTIGRVAVWSSARNADEVMADGSNSGVLDPVAESTLEIYVDFTNPPAVDQSGTATPVTFLNQAQYQIATPGLLLDGHSYADVGGGSLLDFSGSASFTIEGWFNPAGYGSLASRAVVGAVEYAVSFVSTGSGLGAVQFTRGATTVTSASLPIGAWYHFGATYDQADNVLNLYVDGNLQQSLIATGTAPAATTDTLLGASAASGAVGGYFTGMIQNVRFWNFALAQNDLRQWANNQPVAGPTMLGAFDFTVVPPVDTTDQSTITLLGNAAVQTQTFSVAPTSIAAMVGGLTSINADYLNQVPAAPDPPPPSSDVAAQPAPWSDEHREASWQAIVDAFPAETSAEREADLRARFEAGYAEAERRFRENPDLQKGFSKVIQNGMIKLIHHSPQGDVLVWEGAVGSVADCTLLWIQFIYMLTLGFLGAIGLAPTPASVATNVATRIYNLVIANPRALAAITSLLGKTITAAAGISIIGVLWREGLIWPILKFGLTSLGWWALAWVLKQIIAIVTGLEAAAALAGFIVWAVQLTNLALQFPTTCGNSRAVAAA